MVRQPVAVALLTVAAVASALGVATAIAGGVSFAIAVKCGRVARSVARDARQGERS